MQKIFRMLFVCLLAGFLLCGCGRTGNVSQGICLVTKDQSYLVLLGNEVACMENCSGDENLFAALKTGDQIEITHSDLRLSFPAQTQVYACKKIGDNRAQEIPDSILTHLRELNWIIE